MKNIHILSARLVEPAEIARFELEEGEDLDQRVIQEIKKAAESGALNRMAIRVGLPAMMLSRLEEGENLVGGENNTAVALYAPDGEPIGGRSFRVDPVGDGNGYVAYAIEDEIGRETILGMFPDPSVAETVGMFWRNGHLHLPAETNQEDAAS